MNYQHPEYLVETDWLHTHLADPNLRVLDCTAYLPNYFDASAAQKVEIVSGRDHYEQGHIPGSAFADIIHELSDQQNKRFMFPMPSAAQFAAAMSRYGVGEDNRVVLYDDMFNLPPEQLQALAVQSGATGKERVICYCGGAIAASSSAFALSLLGVENVAVYDGSLTEWAADPTLPLVTGEA